MNINIDNKFDSSKLLFSIPVHEEQDVINNQIENILNNNPNSKIILHINKSFSNFVNKITNYENVFFNPIKYSYSFGKGLLFIHINNFLEAIKLNIDFEYFIILSSNEMFIKKGLIDYIEKWGNGLQIVKYDSLNSWHNFNKNLENDKNVRNLINFLNLDTFYGGQTEGQFYEKNVFKIISDIYFKIFGSNEQHNFETEEIISQTIFKSFNTSHGLPFTLQNYCNKIEFNEKFINNLINNNIIIPNNYIENTLLSPHVGLDSSSIFSIKRVDRSFNNIRNLLSNKGFILNKDEYIIDTLYYSNNSIMKILSYDHISFKKYKSNNIKYFHWFGYEIDIGNYEVTFKIKINIKLNNINEKIGLKIHYPHEIIYNYFLKTDEINKWIDVKIPINIYAKDYMIFIFDEYLEDLDIEIKDFKINNFGNETSSRENILLFLYDELNKNSGVNQSYNNIKKMIIDKLEINYNIYIFNYIYKENIHNTINIYKPNICNIINNKSYKDIF